MYTRQKNLGFVRASAILSAVMVLIAGVTFAALRSQNNVISGSRLTSASANLYLSKQAEGGYANTIPGYDFLNIVPGGQPGPSSGNDLYLRNSGSTDLNLGVTLNPARLSLSNGASAARTRLLVVDGEGDSQFASYTIDELVNAYYSGSPLPLNLVAGKQSTIHLRLRMQLEDAGSDTTQEQSIDNMDFIFSGTSA